MANKFGYNLSNKRNREIFGPSWWQIIAGTIIALGLVILLLVMLGDDEETTDEVYDYEETSSASESSVVETGQEGTEQQAYPYNGRPLPSIPIVEFTEETVFGDASGDDALPSSCKERVESSKRRLARLYADAKANERNMWEAETRLGEEIKNLERILEKLYTERDDLELSRSCEADEKEETSEEDVEEIPPAEEDVPEELEEEVIDEEQPEEEQVEEVVS